MVIRNVRPLRVPALDIVIHALGPAGGDVIFGAQVFGDEGRLVMKRGRITARGGECLV